MGEKYKRNWKKVTGVRPEDSLRPDDVLRVKDGINGIPVDISSIASGQILVYDGTQFVPASGSSGGGGGIGDVTQENLAASGFVVGPPSSAHNEVAFFDGVTGKLLSTGSGTIFIDEQDLLNIDRTVRFNTGDVDVEATRVIFGADLCLTNGDVIPNNMFFWGMGPCTSGNLTSNPRIGQIHHIKDSNGIAGSSPITISGNSNTIDGQNTVQLVNNYEAIGVIFNGNEWSII